MNRLSKLTKLSWNTLKTSEHQVWNIQDCLSNWTKCFRIWLTESSLVGNQDYYAANSMPFALLLRFDMRTYGTSYASHNQASDIMSSRWNWLHCTYVPSKNHTRFVSDWWGQPLAVSPRVKSRGHQIDVQYRIYHASGTQKSKTFPAYQWDNRSLPPEGGHGINWG